MAHWQQFEAALGRHTADFQSKVRAEYEGVLARAAEEHAQGLAEVEKKRQALQEEIEVRAVAVFCVAPGARAVCLMLWWPVIVLLLGPQAMGRVHAHARSRVELNVGGHHFTTSVATLRSKPGTMLDAMFRWP
jgi:hypothetical protein